LSKKSLFRSKTIELVECKERIRTETCCGVVRVYSQLRRESVHTEKEKKEKFDSFSNHFFLKQQKMKEMKERKKRVAMVGSKKF
jgi:hypothetical protein